MEIRINGKKIKAQILPVDKPTLDETLESFSFALVSNDNPMPYAPCQSVQVITDSNEKINLFLVTDSVEVYSISPTRWKHNITCVQNTRKLSKHLVRNSSFTNPYYLESKSYSSFSSVLRDGKNEEVITPGNGIYDVAPWCQNDNYVKEKATLRIINNYTTEKVKDAYFLLRCVGFKYGSFNNINDIDEITDAIRPYAPNAQIHNVLQLHYEDYEGHEYTENIYPYQLGANIGDFYVLNKKVKFERVKELALQGYHNFCIYFTGSLVTGELTRSTGWDTNSYIIISLQAEIILETYYYTCYEILDMLRIRQQKQREENGIIVSENSLFNLDLTRELEQMLNTVPAPNFTFTQMTMYECVAEVFRLFDAIFTMDENGYLGIEYFNERNGRNITSSLKKVGQNSSSSEDKYTNGLVAYYQNAKPTEEFPNTTSSSSNLWASIKTKELAVPADNNSFIFETPHSIDTMIAASLLYKNLSFEITYKPLDLSEQQPVEPSATDTTLDISHYLIEEQLWTLLDKTQDIFSGETPNYLNPSDLVQINTIFYKKGTREIDVSYNYKRYGLTTKFAIKNMVLCALGRMVGATIVYDPAFENTAPITIDIKGGDPEWNQIFLRCKYITDVDGRIRIESPQRKYDGETLIDQYNGAVDLNKMGLNILGLSLKLGNPTLTVTQKITSWNNRIKQGDIYIYEGKTWIANVVAYTFLGNGKIQATIQFVQNFNNLAMRTQLLREKRLSLISNELTVKSEENIMEYIYFSTTNFDIDHTGIAYKHDVLSKNLYASLGGGVNNAIFTEVAVIEANSTSDMIYVPMIKYGSGNSVCYEISFDDPISAGKQTSYYNDGWFISHTHYYTNIARYANVYGEFELANLYFTQSTEIGMYLDQFPVVDAVSPYRNIEIRNLRYYKQPNEVFALNYQMCFLPMDVNKDFIGSKFINYNVFTNDTVRNLNDLILYYRNDDFQYSILDIKGSGTSINIMSVTYGNPNIHTTSIQFGLNEYINAKSWAICERDGTILFASNRKITNANSVELCFATNSHRVDKKILDEF